MPPIDSVSGCQEKGRFEVLQRRHGVFAEDIGPHLVVAPESDSKFILEIRGGKCVYFADRTPGAYAIVVFLAGM